MKTKKRYIITFAAMMMLLMTACSKKKDTLTVGIMPDLDSIPFVVAEQQGYFDDNVKLEIYKSPVDRDSAFYSGNMDGTISDVLAACLAQEGDFPVYITSKTNGRYGIVASKKSGVTTPKMMEGKEIGLSLNTIIEYVTDRMVAADGGDPSLLVKTSVPKIPSRLELLQNNQITAVAMPEPYITAAGSEGDTILSTSDVLGINPGVMLFTKEAVEKKESELKDFYEAYDKAVEYINNNDPAKFMPGVIKELGLPESALTVELPDYQKTVLPEETEVLSASEWLREKEMIKNEYSYEELVKEIK